MEFDRMSQVHDNYFEYRILRHPTKRWSAFTRRVVTLPVKYSIFPEAISSSGVISFVSGILAGVAAVHVPDGRQSVTSLFRGNPVAAALFSEGRTRESHPIISTGLILYHLKKHEVVT